MKLGIDARPLEHPHTGIGRYTKEILEYILTLRDWSVILYSARPLKNSCKQTTNVAYKIPGIPNVAAFQARVGQLCKQHDVDVFFGPRHQLPLALDCPSVVTIHDMSWLKARDTMRLSRSLVDATLMPRAIERATKVIAVSNHTRAEICDFFPDAEEKTRTIYEAAFCNASQSQAIDSIAKPFILAVGTQEPRKNYDRLLAAFQKVTQLFENQHLVIAGGDGWKTDLKSTIKTLGLTKHVTLLGGVNDMQLKFLYEACQFLAMPSLYEGFGLPLVEAMNYNKPALTSNNSAMREIAFDAALLVDPLDVESIANGLLKLVSDDQLRDDLAKRATVRKSFFSWNKAAEETARTIEAAYSTR